MDWNDFSIEIPATFPNGVETTIDMFGEYSTKTFISAFEEYFKVRGFTAAEGAIAPLLSTGIIDFGNLELDKTFVAILSKAIKNSPEYKKAVDDAWKMWQWEHDDDIIDADVKFKDAEYKPLPQLTAAETKTRLEKNDSKLRIYVINTMKEKGKKIIFDKTYPFVQGVAELKAIKDKYENSMFMVVKYQVIYGQDKY